MQLKSDKMKKIELAAYLQAGRQCLEQMLQKPKDYEDKLLDDEAQLLSQMNDFFQSKAISKKHDEENIDFEEFLMACKLDVLKYVSEKGFLAKFCRTWLEQSEHNEYTFLLTDIRQVPLRNLIYLEGYYEKIHEILAWMKSRAKHEKNIFVKPGIVGEVSFSQDSINALKGHTVTRDFITTHEIGHKKRPKSQHASVMNFFGDKAGMIFNAAMEKSRAKQLGLTYFDVEPKKTGLTYCGG